MWKVSRQLLATRTRLATTSYRMHSNATNSTNANSNSTKVGVIGLGNMGASMAKNLIKNGFNTTVFDLNPIAIQQLVAAGGREASSVAELSANCDVIVTMLPATKHVSGTLLGSDGVFANAKPGSVVIDSSTIDPIVTQSLHLQAIEHKLHMIDAPVSGGVTGAAAGTLTFMVGGDVKVMMQVEDVLKGMGKNIVHCGTAGAGEIAKLCNNMALAISMIGTSEAMALGVRLGMDAATLAGIMNTSTARCWSSDSYSPVPGLMPNVPSSKNYDGGFGTALMEKDLTLAMNVANASKARVPLGSAAHQLYGMLCEQGLDKKDFSVVYDFIMKTQSERL